MGELQQLKRVIVLGVDGPCGMVVAATLDPVARPQAGVDRFAEPCDYDELVGGDQMVAESVRSRSVRP